MELSATIDWISCTKKDFGNLPMGVGGLRRFISASLPKFLGIQDWKYCKAFNGYTVAMESEAGITVLTNPDRRDMGLHMKMSGGTIAKCQAMNIDIMELVVWLVGNGFIMSRIDVAIDAIDSGLKIDTLASLVSSGDVVTRARSAPYIEDKLGLGRTQYIGSMKKRKKLFRAYRKDAQLGLKDVDWNRFELELHGKSAVSATDTLMKADSLQKTVQQLILGYVDFPTNPTWVEIFGSDILKIGVPADEKGDTRKWLLESVAPSLARVLDEDESFMYQFMKVVGDSRK